MSKIMLLFITFTTTNIDWDLPGFLYTFLKGLFGPLHYLSNTAAKVIFLKHKPDYLIKFMKHYNNSNFVYNKSQNPYNGL